MTAIASNAPAENVPASALPERIINSPLAIYTVALVWTMHIDCINQTLPPALLLSGLCAERAAPEFGRVPERARLGALASISLAIALRNCSGDFTNRHPTQGIAEATTAIRATKRSNADRLFAMNRGLWLNAATDPAPHAVYPSFPYALRVRPAKRSCHKRRPCRGATLYCRRRSTPAPFLRTPGPVRSYHGGSAQRLSAHRARGGRQRILRRL